MPIQRDAEQIDALSEIFNIGVGKAAAAMGRLLRDEVLLSVPHVSVFTVNEAAQQLGTQGHPMYGVRQPFRGVLNGDALLIFPGHRSLEIVRIVAGQNVPRRPCRFGWSCRWDCVACPPSCAGACCPCS